MTLQDWLDQHRISWYDKQVEKYLSLEIVEEVNSFSMNWNDYIQIIQTKAPFKAQYVFSFVVLTNGKAVGLNENPSRGYSTPVVNYKN